MSRRGDYASGLFQAYFLFLLLFSPFITKLLKGAIFRPKIFFTKLLLPPQKFAALGGRLVRLVVKPALDIDSSQLTLLALFDVSAAFDTVDHEILRKRLEISFGLSGNFLSWVGSFLSERSLCVVHEPSRSAS